MNQLNDVTQYFRRGVHMATSKPLRPWILIPLAFNIVLFGALYWYTGHAINQWIEGLLGNWHPDGFWSFMNSLLPYLEGLLSVLIWLLLLVLMSNFFTLVVQLIAAPFMGFLAEKVNRNTCSVPLPEESMAAMLKRTLFRELRKFWYTAWRSVAVFIVVAIFYFIPGLNLVASVGWFVFCGWLLAMQYVDFGADCRQVSMQEMLDSMKEKRWLVLGFGCLMLVLTMLPLVNLVIMPIGVITGTLIWNEQLDRKLLAAPQQVTQPAQNSLESPS